MSLHDNTRQYNVRRRAAGATNKFWSDAQKVEAVTLWLSMGNLALVAATLRIPEPTIRHWRSTQWWKEIAEEIQLQDKIQLSARAKNVIDKSMEVIADRLEQGDWIYDQKAGQMRRKPVAMKDALAVADKLMDRKDKLDKTLVVQDSTESVEAKLTKLMEKFSAVASGAAQPQVTDVIYVKEGDSPQEQSTLEENHNAPHEEREEGLQLRQGISETPGTSEEQGGEECSEEDH